MRFEITKYSSLPQKMLADSVADAGIMSAFLLDEGTGNALNEVGAEGNLTAGNAPGSALSLFNNAAAGARTFNGTNQYFQGTLSTGGEAWSAAEAKGLSFLVKFDDFSSGDAPILGVTESDGTPVLVVSSTSLGEIKVEWYDGATRSYQLGASLVNGDVFQVCVAQTPYIGANVRTSIFIFNLSDPTVPLIQGHSTSFEGSTSSEVEVTLGADYGLTTFFDGTLDEVCFWNYAITEATARELAANYTARYDEEDLYTSVLGYDTYLKVFIEQADGSYVDVTNLNGLDYLLSFEIHGDCDQRLVEGTVTIEREFYNNSLAYNLTSSALHNGSTNIIDLARQLKAATAVVPSDQVPRETDYTMIFEGFIDNIDWTDQEISCAVRDRMAALEDTFIEPNGSGIEREYGSVGGVAVETVMQAVIDDNEPASSGSFPGGYLGDGRPQVVLASSSAFAIKPFAQQLEPVAEAVSFLGTLPGWRLSYRWCEFTQSFALEHQEPDRSATVSQYTITDDRYDEMERVAIDVDMIRNAVSVGVHSGTPDSEDEDPRNYTTVSDEASMIAYGRRWCRVGEASSSYLDTDAEAAVLANALLSDLKDPVTEFTISMPFFRRCQVNDYYTVGANNIHLSAGVKAAVYGWTQTFDESGARTRLELRAQPAAKVAGWLDYIVLPGVQGTLPRRGVSSPSTPTVNIDVPGMARVSWVRPVNRLNRNYDVTMVHRSTSSGFTPSSANLVAVVKGDSCEVEQEPGTTQYYKVIHKDKFSNITVASSASTAAVSRYHSSVVPRASVYRTADLTSISSGSTQVVLNNDSTGDAYDIGGNYNTSTGEFTAPFAGECHVDIALEGDFVSKTTGLASLQVRKNGTLFREFPFVNPVADSSGTATSSFFLEGSVDVPVAASDTVEIWANVSDTWTLVGGASSSWANFRMVGQT